MKPIRIHYFQHVPFEGLGYIEEWAVNNNHQLSATKFYEDFTLPKITSFDWLVVMGGPMGVNDFVRFPWLKDEIELIKQAINKNKTVIGICLGSQLIASALGSKVYQNTNKEIGWFPLAKTEVGKNHALISELPNHFNSFHWHGDTFDLPHDSAHLLKTDICTNQAFLYNDKVLGLQFHFEVTAHTLKQMITNCRYELAQEAYIQSEQEILSRSDFCKKSNGYLDSILTKLASIE